MFIDCSHLIRSNPPRLHYGVAVVDINGDGVWEMFIAGFDGANRVLRWDGAGFVDILDETLADARRQAIGVAAGDLDGDGQEEIYVLNTDTFTGRKRFGDRLFDFQEDGWVDLFELPQNREALNLTAGRSVAVVDRLGIGRYGFFVANYGGPFRLYELDRFGEVQDMASAAGVSFTTGGRGVIALPLVTPRMDLFTVNENGPNLLFANRGDGTFEEIARRAGLPDPHEHGRGVAAGDFDGDGRFDLVYGNWEGPHRLFLQKWDGLFVDAAPSDMAEPSRVRTVIAADFDNDGELEIFFNNIGEPNRLFARRGDTWTKIDPGEALEPGGLGTGAAVGDFDNDGRLELLISHGEADLQPLSLYRPVPNQYAWLRILPLTRAGAPARGAVVAVVAGGRRQLRAVDAGSGYLCQMEAVAHFGLGSVDAVESVEVYWPDGATTTITAPEVNRLIRVPHP
ncbi:CRTAC1 family protein [Roseiflexus sp.]|uniref:CRTAC1 family protein n=1 Tax=Roseiflexus sp. TaxID=2562120 RepID=UPI00398B7486